jgi:hypothetical protein
MTKVYYKVTPVSSKSAALKSFSLSFDLAKDDSDTQPQGDTLSTFNGSGYNSPTSGLSQIGLLTDTLEHSKPPLPSRSQKVAEVVRDQSRQIESWRKKYFAVKDQAASQASLIEELVARCKELQLQVELQDRTVVKGLEAIIANKNAEIRQLEYALQGRDAELKALDGLLKVRQIAVELQESKKYETVEPTYSPAEIMELIRENEALKARLTKATTGLSDGVTSKLTRDDEAKGKRPKTELSREALDQLDSQFAELEKMQASLMAENKVLRNERSRFQVKSSRQDSEYKLASFSKELAKVKTELSQINQIAKNMASGGELSLDLLLGKQPGKGDTPHTTHWEKLVQTLNELKLEVGVLRQTVSDHYAAHCSSRGCQTQ